MAASVKPVGVPVTNLLLLIFQLIALCSGCFETQFRRWDTIRQKYSQTSVPCLLFAHLLHCWLVISVFLSTVSHLLIKFFEIGHEGFRLLTPLHSAGPCLALALWLPPTPAFLMSDPYNCISEHHCSLSLNISRVVLLSACRCDHLMSVCRLAEIHPICLWSPLWRVYDSLGISNEFLI